MSETSPAAIEAAEVTPEFVRRRGPHIRVVEVHDDGEVIGAFLGPKEFEHYRELVRREVEVFRAGELSDDLVAALEESLGKYGVGVE